MPFDVGAVMPMQVFNEAGGVLRERPEDGFASEKELQSFVERNLGTLLRLQFVATEFRVSDRCRIDTLAYDEESESFVVIEDKNVRNISLVDQGFDYLAAILDRKERVVLEFNRVRGESRGVEDFDWSQSRIVFISPEFTERQVRATSFRDMPFELYELRKYGDTYSWRGLTRKILDGTPRPRRAPSGRTPGADPLDEIRVYTEDDIITDSNPAYPQYLRLRESITEFPDVSVTVLKTGIQFKVNGRMFGEVSKAGVTRTKFDLLLAYGDGIKDPHGLLVDISRFRWGILKHRMAVGPDADVEAVVYLLRQSYDRAKSTVRGPGRSSPRDPRGS